MTPRFTVLLPIVRPPLFLPYAIETVLAQTVAEFEVFIICDGAPPETIRCGEEFAARDPRVKVLTFPKGERIGEGHWHAALEQAKGTYIAHFEDDDLWFPNHLEELQALLQTVDFGHTLHVWVTDKGEIEALPTDIGLPEVRQSSLDGLFNQIGFSVCGYRLAAYRSLPEGWAPSPVGVWPDLHMWRKFYRSKDLKFGTRMAVTALVVPTHLREDASSNRRKDENLHWYERVQDRQGREDITEAAWRSINQSAVKLKILDTKTAEDLKQTRVAHNECVTELGRMTQSRDHYEAEAGRLRASREDVIAEVGRVTQSRDHFEAEVYRLRDSRDEVTAELGRMTESRNHFEAEIQRLIASYAHIQDERRSHEILKEEVEHLRQRRDAGEAELARVTRLLSSSQTELQQLSTACARSQTSLVHLTAAHAVTKAELENVLGSQSWRLTRPLRASQAMAARLGRKLRKALRTTGR